MCVRRWISLLYVTPYTYSTTIPELALQKIFLYYKRTFQINTQVFPQKDKDNSFFLFGNIQYHLFTVLYCPRSRKSFTYFQWRPSELKSSSATLRLWDFTTRLKNQPVHLHVLHISKGRQLQLVIPANFPRWKNFACWKFPRWKSVAGNAGKMEIFFQVNFDYF